MTWSLIEFAIVLIGLSASAVLFFRFPKLPKISEKPAHFPRVSVIIPARNEEKNISLLLADLKTQTVAPFEIICVDDASSDATVQIAKAHQARVISLRGKPDGWTGKTWACQNGADVATGDLLLFLDADVRLGQNGIRKLLQAYADFGCTISVQPYHKTQKAYEQLSLLFNLVQIAANGTALNKPRNIGLCGPVILIMRADYQVVGGHKSVRKSVVEDLALGKLLSNAALPYQLFIGDSEIAFRMYADGLSSLLQGWVKNLAAGAVRTPPLLFALVFFWIASVISVPLHIVQFALTQNMPWLMVYAPLYVVWAVILWILARRVGLFHLWAILLYPILTIALVGVFLVSMFKRIFGLKVVWKGRAIEKEGKSCE